MKTVFMKTVSFLQVKAFAAALLSLVLVVNVSAIDIPENGVISENGDYTYQGTIISPINVSSGITAIIRFVNVTMFIPQNSAALNIGDQATIHLILSGKNHLIGSGISLSADANLTIDGDGKLDVDNAVINGQPGSIVTINNGMIKVIDEGNTAVIGNVGTLTVNDGKIEAISEEGEGIGNVGTLTVNGGRLEATSRGNAAGVSVNTLTVYGGRLEATSQGNAAGVSVNTLTINGGEIEAISEGNASGIHVGTLTVNDGKIEAISEGNASGIGNASSLTMNNGEVRAISKGHIGIGDINTFTVNGGRIEAISEGNVGIGNVGTFAVSGGAVEAISKGNIGISVVDMLAISGGTVKATGGGSATVDIKNIAKFYIVNNSGAIIGKLDNTLTLGLYEVDDEYNRGDHLISPVAVEFYPSIPPFSDHQLQFLDLEEEKKATYHLNDLSIGEDNRVSVFLPPVLAVPGKIALSEKGRNSRYEDTLYVSSNRLFIPLEGDRSDTLTLQMRGYVEIIMTGNNGLALQAAFEDGTPILSGHKYLADKENKIRFQVLPHGVNDRPNNTESVSYVYKWTILDGGNATHVHYTDVPEMIVGFYYKKMDVECEIVPQHPVKYKLSEESSAGIQLSAYEIGSNQPVTDFVTRATALGFSITDDALGVYEYEYAVTVNGQLKSVGAPVNMQFPAIQSVSEPIEVECTVKRMQKIYFDKVAIYNNGVNEFTAQYNGNTFDDLSANSHGETYSVNTGDWVTPGGSLFLTGSPVNKEDVNIYKYTFAWEGGSGETFSNAMLRIDNVPFDKKINATGVSGPYRLVGLSLAGAPAGTVLNVAYGSAVDALTTDGTEKIVQKTTLLLLNNAETPVFTVALPDDGFTYVYRWNKEEQFSDNPELRGLSIEACGDIRCEVQRKCKIEYSLDEKIEGVELSVTYDDQVVTNGAVVFPGKKLVATAVGTNVHLYRFVWEGAIVNSDSSALIVEVDSNVNIKCTPIKMKSIAVLENILVATGVDTISMLVGGVDTVNWTVSHVTVEAIPQAGSNATVSAGNGEYALATGENKISIKVLSEDKLTEKEYQIRIIRKKREVDEGEEPTGMALPGAASVRVYADGQILYIDTPEAEQVSVYSLAGRLLDGFAKPAGVSSYRIEKARAVIVRGGSGWVRKVVAQ